MKQSLIRKTTIYHPKIWKKQDQLYFAISQDGQLIVVRSDIRPYGNDNAHNVFVYNTDGKLVDSFISSNGGEPGVVFWPDKYHILTPGYTIKDHLADGLKCQKIGSNDFTTPLSYSPLSGINVRLYGASDNGRYVLGESPSFSGLFCIDTHNRKPISLGSGRISNQIWFFASNDKYTAGVTVRTNLSWLDLSSSLFALPSGKTIWTGDRFLCFSPDGNHFVSRDRAEIVVCDLPTCQVVSRHSVDGTLTIATYSSNGKWFATGDENGSICLRNASDYSIETKLESVHATPIQQVKFSADNTELITISSEEIVIWHLA